MIVVIGSPSGRHQDARIVAGGLAAGIAIEAARAGRRVELVGRIGDDEAADAVLQDLARSAVGHVAMLRDQARPTPIDDATGATSHVASPSPEVDGADVDLALRYLTDFQVIVLVEPIATSVVEVVARAIEWAQATLVVAGTMETTGARTLPRHAAETPAAYESRVATVAVELDRPAA